VVQAIEFWNIMLLAPPRGGKKRNLSSILKARSVTDHLPDPILRTTKQRSAKSDLASLAANVTSKIEDGNIKAALRLLSSDDRPASDNDATIAALQARHPPAAPDRKPLPPSRDYNALQVTEAELIAAIKSFPAGSAGGPDGIRPQHILDLTNNREAGPALVTSLTFFVNMLLAGRCPATVIPVFFGGSLIALEKKCGGVRPIAIGYTLRRLAAKCANTHAIHTIGAKLLPEQLGLGTPGGSEAAVHATRRFLADMPPDYIIAKLDFNNAFNNIHRDDMLSAVAEHVPSIYQFCLSSYENTTLLKFSNNTILSQEGCQQGDPLGPLLFCLAIHPLITACNSPLKMAFMDDVTLGGPAAIVASDVAMIKAEGALRGLFLNDRKCESITANGQPPDDVLLRDFVQLTPTSATLLGAPLVIGPAMDKCLQQRCDDLERVISRLELITSHDALVLLRASFSAPTMQHTLRSAPCAGCVELSHFDALVRSALSKICNISSTDDQWLQASLPVRAGGLGLRRVSSLATPAFNLQNQILHTEPTAPSSYSDLDFYLQSWHAKYGDIPTAASPAKQQTWDKPIVQLELSQLLERHIDVYDKARLLAATSKHSGDWLHAIPISSCGLRLDNEAVRMAVCFRLGIDICEPHPCVCGHLVDTRGSHALSCKRTSGRLIRHNHLNDIVLRSLSRASIPATREPAGLLRSDGKRPDGLTLIPWREGRCLVWDVTVADTTAASYLPSTSVSAGSAAESAATRKQAKYAELSQRYEFVPIAVESHGSFSSTAIAFLAELGRRLSAATCDPRETAHLFQRLSVALQRFNAVCVYDTFAGMSEPDAE
jgi:hypothetical protein